MRRGARQVLCTGLLALAPLLAARDLAASDSPRLELSVETPAADSVVGDPSGMVFVAGQALALYGEYQKFDIVFAIDTSASTAAPSGADIDGDGVVGEAMGGGFLAILGRSLPLPMSDTGDSILAAELAAVRKLLDQLDPRTTRVGIVTFAGDADPFTPDAFTVVPLTTEYDRVRRGLRQIRLDGPKGNTNMVTAVNLATIELLGTRSAYSEPRPNSRKIIMFLTDGYPTLPIESSSRENSRLAIQQAVRTGKLGIRIDTFGIGPDALSKPVVVVEMARVSKGVFTPIRNPGDLQRVFESITFSDIQTLRVRNRTNQKEGEHVTQNADGTFSALLPMEEGVNTIEVFARTTDGTEGVREVQVVFLPKAPSPELSPRLLAQRNRLLEARLLDLRRRRLEIQAERDADVLQNLREEIALERQKAEQSSDEMRRELEIDVERKPPAPSR